MTKVYEKSQAELKAAKKEVLFGKVNKSAKKTKAPLMAHWNNDSGCRV